MANWPGSLQQCFSTDWQEVVDPNTIATDMDSGPAKARRRFNRKRRSWSGSIVCDVTQYQTFVDWFDTTIGGGILPFNWEHPFTKEPLVVQFRRDKGQVSPPVVGAYQGGALVRVSIAIEEQ